MVRAAGKGAVSQQGRKHRGPWRSAFRASRAPTAAAEAALLLGDFCKHPLAFLKVFDNTNNTWVVLVFFSFWMVDLHSPFSLYSSVYPLSC